MRDRTIFAHAVLEFGGCRWVGRQPPCVREDRKMESKGGVYLALDFIIRYPSKGVFDIQGSGAKAKQRLQKQYSCGSSEIGTKTRSTVR